MPSFSISPAGFVTQEWVQRPKSAYQCRKLKASIRIPQIFHLKQPLWATEWFQNCWCTPHEEGVAVDTGLMSSLALTICNWVSYKTLYVYIKFEKCLVILVTSLHQGTEIYIVLWGGGKGNPLKIGINLGASEIIKTVNNMVSANWGSAKQWDLPGRHLKIFCAYRLISSNLFEFYVWAMQIFSTHYKTESIY